MGLRRWVTLTRQRPVCQSLETSTSSPSESTELLGAIGIHPNTREVVILRDGHERLAIRRHGVAVHSLLARDQTELIAARGRDRRCDPRRRGGIARSGARLADELDFPEGVFHFGALPYSNAFSGKEIVPTSRSASRLRPTDFSCASASSSTVNGKYSPTPHASARPVKTVARLGIRMHDVENLVAQRNGRHHAAVERGQLQALEEAALGQHVIGAQGGFRHLNVHDDAQIQGIQALLQIHRVGITRNHIGVVEEHALDSRPLSHAGQRTHSRPCSKQADIPRTYFLPSGFGTAGNFSSSSLPAETLERNSAPPFWFQQPSSVLNTAMARAVSPELAY